MSLTQRIFFGAAASWFGRGVSILLGLVLLPVLFRTLPQEELGIWLLLGQSWATISIFDFGFGVTLTRQIAFAKAQSGSDPSAELNGNTQKKIADLLALGLRVYRVLGILAFSVSLGLGFVYLRDLTLSRVSFESVWVAWGILCVSQGLTIWANPWTCLLQGVGYVGWEVVLATFVSAMTLVGQIISTLCGGGLLSLAMIAGLGVLGQRMIMLRFARFKRPELFKLSGVWRAELFRGMLPLAGKAWLTGLGSALILYTDQFVIATLEGPAELPMFRAAWILVHNITIVATTLAVASGVFVSHLWQTRELGQVHRLLERNLRFGWLSMLTGAALLIFAGEPLFTLWLGPGNFVGPVVMVAILISAALGAQAYIVSCASRATGDEGFAWISLGAGLLKLVLSITLAKHYGLLGVALGTLIALMVTSDWYVPWRGLKVLRYPRWLLLRKTVMPTAGYFLVVCGALAWVQKITVTLSPLMQFSLAALAAACLFACGAWILVMEVEHKQRLLSMLGRMRAQV